MGDVTGLLEWLGNISLWVLSLMVIMVTLNASAGLAGQILSRVTHYKTLPTIGLVVTIAAVSCSSPFGPIQLSHRPAKAKGPPPLRRTKYGRFFSPSRFHS